MNPERMTSADPFACDGCGREITDGLLVDTDVLCDGCATSRQRLARRDALAAHLQANHAPAIAPVSPSVPDDGGRPYYINDRLLARLVAMRAAVAAGFYNEG